MPAVVIDQCICTGHGCWPPRQNSTRSDKFFVTKRGSVRVGDGWQVHSCESAHAGKQISGSAKLFIQGRAAARVGDKINCGSKNMTGSSKMFCAK